MRPSKGSRRRIGFVLLLALCVGSVALPASPAEASHWTGPEICGQGTYRTVLVAEIGPSVADRIGNLVLTKHENSDTFCAVTLRRYHERQRSMDVRIKRGNGAWWQTDPTNGYEYAGPVYREKNGGIIVAHGQIGGRWTRLYWKDPNHWAYEHSNGNFSCYWPDEVAPPWVSC
jgi:hypothetical protein